MRMVHLLANISKLHIANLIEKAKMGTAKHSCNIGQGGAEFYFADNRDYS